jgi:outer membrane protein
MNRWVLLIAGLLLLSFAGIATAAEKNAPEKIGFVDVREIMMNSDTGKKANEELKKIYDRNRLLIQGSEAELQKMKDEVERQRTILTEAALKEKEAAYQKKFRDYQTLVKEANDDLQAKDQEFSKSIIPEIQKLVNSIGEKEKFTVIFDLSAMPIPFYNKAGDLTKRVMEEFNKTNKPKK